MHGIAWVALGIAVAWLADVAKVTPPDPSTDSPDPTGATGPDTSPAPLADPAPDLTPDHYADDADDADPDPDPDPVTDPEVTTTTQE